jgi:hypothetical protein
MEEQGQAKVLVAVDGDDCAEHGKPEEAEGGGLIDPDIGSEST